MNCAMCPSWMGGGMVLGHPNRRPPRDAARGGDRQTRPDVKHLIDGGVEVSRANGS